MSSRLSGPFLSAIFVFCYCLLSDSLCRFLPTLQRIPVQGVTSGGQISDAVTHGDTLYVMKIDYSSEPHTRAFIYDIDQSHIRHTHRHRRRIICRNRRPLVVAGLTCNVSHIVPCAINNCVYVIEKHLDATVFNATVYRVMADGTVSKRWNLETHSLFIQSVSVGDSGRCLVVTTCRKAFVYVASTGLPEHVQELTKEERSKDQLFVWSALLDKTPTMLVTICIPFVARSADIFFCDPDCMLHITRSPGTSLPSTYMVLDLCGQVGRVMINEAETDQGFARWRRNWYDSARGLLFLCEHVH